MAEIICGYGRDHAYSCCPEHGTHKMRSLGGHTRGCPERNDILLSVEPRSGRTSALIQWAFEEKPPPAPMRYIVCHSQQECTRVFRLAMDMGLNIAMPVTWEEMVEMRGTRRPVEFAIDNLSLILPRLVPGRIAGVTW